MSRTALITGVSRGFGRRLAMDMAGRGFGVAGTIRDADGRNREATSALEARGVRVLEADVTDGNAVDAAVRQAVEGLGRIDVLVNSAGFGLEGPLEAVTPEDLEELFATNVVGGHRVVRAVLPAMREQGAGLIVHVSSTAGRVAVPGFGAYCASKWALEAMAEALRYELAPFGIDSTIVEPGPYATDFHGSSMRSVSDPSRATPYVELLDALRRRRESLVLADPMEVVDAIVSLVSLPRGSRPLRVVLHPTLREDLAALNAVQATLNRRIVEAMTPAMLANDEPRHG